MPGVGENRRSQQRAARASCALRKDLHDEIFVNGLMGPGGGSLEGEEQHSRIDVSLSLYVGGKLYYSGMYIIIGSGIEIERQYYIG